MTVEEAQKKIRDTLRELEASQGVAVLHIGLQEMAIISGKRLRRVEIEMAPTPEEGWS